MAIAMLADIVAVGGGDWLGGGEAAAAAGGLPGALSQLGRLRSDLGGSGHRCSRGRFVSDAGAVGGGRGAPLEQALAMAEAIGARPLAARAGRELGWALWHRGSRAIRIGRASTWGAPPRWRPSWAWSICKRPSPVPARPWALAKPAPTGVPTRRPPTPWGRHRRSSCRARRGGDLAADLGGAGHAAQARARSGRSGVGAAQAGREFDVPALGGGDVGEVIDSVMRASCWTRTRELRTASGGGSWKRKMEEAQAWADAGRRDAGRRRSNSCRTGSARAVGRWGGARRSGAAVERAAATCRSASALLSVAGRDLARTGEPTGYRCQNGYLRQLPR